MSFATLQIFHVWCVEIHDVAITDLRVFLEPSIPVYPQLRINANVTVENQGTVNESFKVTLYAGNITIQTLNVTNLQPGAEMNLTFWWRIFPYRIMIFPPPWENPMSLMHRNVTLKAEADVVPGEVDTSDNLFIDGIIDAVWRVPDVNGDGKIDMRDIGAIARRFGSPVGLEIWFDFNSDEKIDMKDIAVTARLFGI
jgi:hypothetical protein